MVSQTEIIPLEKRKAAYDAHLMREARRCGIKKFRCGWNVYAKIPQPLTDAQVEYLERAIAERKR